MEDHDVMRPFVEGKGDAGSGSTKYVQARIVLDADKVDGIV